MLSDSTPEMKEPCEPHALHIKSPFESGESDMAFASYTQIGYVKEVERINKTDATGTLTSYLYDGRGSVVQNVESPRVIQSLTYDPFGEITSGADPYDLTYAHNAEEYNPVTELTYLRARYLAPKRASFITKDTMLGDMTRINSQNRYSYAEADVTPHA